MRKKMISPWAIGQIGILSAAGTFFLAVNLDYSCSKRKTRAALALKILTDSEMASRQAG
tara:strand:+ start:821 stop:997 length:177 start_codon:yes stop_codon:yes gene_type:complete